MKFMAGASAGIMATPLPWKLLDDVSIWTQNWPWIPSNVGGENTFTMAVSKTCPSGAAMKIRLVGGRPVRVLPNPTHPLGGGITALAVAEVQMLYSPGRVKKPMIRSSDGGFRETDWNDVAKIVQQKLTEAKSNAAFISGDETGSVNEVISAFAAAIGSKKVFLMPSEGQCAAKASELMGLKGQIGYDLENSDYVLAIGANILESWGPVARNRRIFAHSHPHPDGKSKITVPFAYAGAVQNSTAAVAKPWLPILPGSEAALALGIAHLLIKAGKSFPASDFEAFKALAAKYTPEETAKQTGVSAKQLGEVVKALLAAKAPCVIVGSEFNQGAGAAPIMAGFAVNALLGNINKEGGLTLIPDAPVVARGASPRAELYKNDLAAWLGGKEVPAVLILHEANPVYALPNPEGVKAALKRIPFKVAFTTFLDETAADCDVVLPIAMGLERTDDLFTPYGMGKSIYCASSAAVQPAANTLSTANALMGLAKKMGFGLGFDLYEDLLKAKAKAMKANYDVLMRGQPVTSEDKIPADGFSARADVLAKAAAVRTGKDKLGLALYSKLNMGTAKTGIPPYNTKTLRANELAGGDMFVMMNAATAGKKSLKDGDRVTLAAGTKKIPARLRVYEGVMNDSVAVCLGFGHTALDEFSRNKGANVMDLLSAAPEPETGLTVWSQAGVDVSKA